VGGVGGKDLGESVTVRATCSALTLSQQHNDSQQAADQSAVLSTREVQQDE